MPDVKHLKIILYVYICVLLRGVLLTSIFCLFVNNFIIKIIKMIHIWLEASWYDTRYYVSHVPKDFAKKPLNNSTIILTLILWTHVRMMQHKNKIFDEYLCKCFITNLRIKDLESKSLIDKQKCEIKSLRDCSMSLGIT